MEKEKEEDTRPEKPILARHKGLFHCMDVRPVKAAKGANKIRMLLECEYTVEDAEAMAPFFDKDMKIAFQELASKPRRKSKGDDTDQLGLTGEPVAPDPDASDAGVAG